MFRSWRNEAGPAVDVCPVQLAGHGNRIAESPFRRMLPLCDVLAESLLPYLDVPFAFFGHSMGALIAFELARHLRRRARPGPRHLFLSGARAPRRPSAPRLHALPERALLAELRRLNGTAPEFLEEPALMEMVLPLLRADLELYETYVYSIEDLLDCPISALGGVEDSRVSREDLAGWQEETRGAFTLRMFEGDHFFLHGARTPLLRAISEDLSWSPAAAAQALDLDDS